LEEGIIKKGRKKVGEVEGGNDKHEWSQTLNKCSNQVCNKWMKLMICSSR
jgi:hypothetical protein